MGRTQLAEVAGLDVKQLLMGAASTLASLAYAKLERNDLAQAKLAIDGVSALLPLLDGDLSAISPRRWPVCRSHSSTRRSSKLGLKSARSGWACDT